MHFNLKEVSQSNRYKLLTSLVVPRPIGWITSLSPDGVVNLAPYSFFNVLGNDPPVVAFGPNRKRDGSKKDTHRNVESTKTFVANLVTPEVASFMHASAAEFPPDQGEVEVLGLELLPSSFVTAPRLALSPVHFECQYLQTVQMGGNSILFGEILCVHAPDDWIDAQSYRLNADKLVALGRLEGPGHYATTRERVNLGAMPSPETVLQAQRDRHGER